MKLSQSARIYQLQHGHSVIATITHGEHTQKFKCGCVTDSLNKTIGIHGVDVGQNETEIETVDFVKVHVGDTIELAGGVKGKVHKSQQTLLDKNNIQLRFVPFNKAEKITRITIKYL